MTRLRERADGLLLLLATALLLGGGAAWLADALRLADLLWVGGTVLGLLVTSVTTVTALRARRPTVDVIALLALAGALAVEEPFAGAMITVMLASGQALEERAQRRARRELGLLVARAPRTARVLDGDVLRECPVADVEPGQVLVVGPGEVLPVDGRLQDGAVLDESALTGEPLPVARATGDEVRSGSVNAGSALRMVATVTAERSTYAALVRLVEQAQASSAPFVRVADRLAVLFVPLTLAVAGGAWAVSGDPVRAVAVLVVATPCPLLLAAPIAIMSGISRAARAGVVVKGGAALERLAGGQVLVCDKTGTLTRGRPEVVDVLVVGGRPADDVLRLAASVDQVSPHVLAGAVVAAAGRRRQRLTLPDEAEEVHGRGVRGRLPEGEVRVGTADWAGGEDAVWVTGVRRRAERESAQAVFVSLDGLPVGALLLQDRVRGDAPRALRALRGAGIRRIVMLTGDRPDVAHAVGRVVGVDEVRAGQDPAEKLEAVRAEAARATTIMVGDGVNDAPALAAADVGVALAARGATASSEAADVVLTVDRVDALADAILVARRARRIALQAVVVGMGLSVVAMGAASAGVLPPAAGAVLQEGIDVLAMLLALRAVLPGRVHTVTVTPGEAATVRRLRAEHDAVQAVVAQVRAVADGLAVPAGAEPDVGHATGAADGSGYAVRPVSSAAAAVQRLLSRLETELLPHERADEAELVPLVSRLLGGPDTTSALSRTHAEIELQVARLRHAVAIPGPGGALADVEDVRRSLYELHALLRVHDVLEEEGALSVVEGPGR